MKPRHLSDAYRRSFHTYLEHTDEKVVLLRELIKLLGLSTRSILDIGAGNGDLAIPLSYHVASYSAIEQRADYVARLREGGIFAFQEIFPHGTSHFEQRFDLVLSSHSMPWWPRDYQPFLEAALALRKEGGRLVLITYDASGHWSTLRAACDLPLAEGSLERISGLGTWLATQGEVKERRITTRLNTHTLQEMQEALAFVYSDGDEGKIEAFLGNAAVAAHLKDFHYFSSHFAFLFEHVLFEVR